MACVVPSCRTVVQQHSSAGARPRGSQVILDGMDVERQPSDVSEPQEKDKPDRFVSLDPEALSQYVGRTKDEFRAALLRADDALQKSRTFTPTLPSEPKKRSRRR